MTKYARKYPQFALCGLNCGLCPRYHTDGASKCPGCGGKDFHLKHPTCAVITCTKKHDGAEYCFQCSSYPCERYNKLGQIDSFMSYKNVINNFKKAKEKGVDKYKKELDEKIAILEWLIKNYNDGRRKAFYCLAVDLLQLDDLNEIKEQIKNEIDDKKMDIKEKSKIVVELFALKAQQRKIELTLRKK